MRSLALAAILPSRALLGCSRADSAPPKRSICKVNAARLPDGDPNGRWGVELPIEDAVLKAHGARFEKYGAVLPSPAAGRTRNWKSRMLLKYSAAR